ncbi:MAG: PD40 domain-containing protein [Ignavibacteria bacterium]|nr:PD40 domain-containing protein [Ignavibacteria bacterium]
MKYKIFFTVLFTVSLITKISYPQFEPHPQVQWFTIETENFNVVYHPEAERTAKTTAKIAEEIIGPITSLYNFKPKDKTNFVINDLSDEANGATDFFNNRIEIFASALDFELRGTHNWLRNVITHEYTHMVQLQASMKLSRNVPAVYLQWLNYEKEKRPDVLYGYPNAIVSYPLSGIGVPMWFAEGTAQYQRQGLGYEKWDAHRDMILRTYVEENKMLTYNEMGQFSSVTSLKAESIYNSGFALVRYIASKYGEDKLRDISKNLGNLFNFSMDKALRETIGKDGPDLYNEWKQFLKADYSRRLRGVKDTKIEGEIIESKGFANYFPKFSPDGTKIAYLTNRGLDFALTRIVVYDINTKKSQELEITASNFDWSPDGKKIIYSARNIPASLDGITKYDLFLYDFSKKESKKITNNKRAFSPSFSPDGEKIVYLVNRDGTLNLEISDKGGKIIKRLTEFRNGEQIYNPKFSPDGNYVIFEYSLEEARKIGYYDLHTDLFEFILNEPETDFRNPVISGDGKDMFYSSDKTGIFNIYKYDFVTRESVQITNVLGGAFMPSLDNKGNLVYATYHSSGYKISLLKNFGSNEGKNIVNYDPPPKLIEQYAYADSLSNNPESSFNWNKLRNFNDKDIEKYPSSEYKTIFNQLMIFPVIRFDNYTSDKNNNDILDNFKPGLYFHSDELMTRFTLFGGGFLNRKGERDLFLQFEYNDGFPVFGELLAKKAGFHPKLFFEGYNVTRKANAKLIAALDSITVGVNYNLLAFYLGMTFPIINNRHNIRLEYSYSKYASEIDPFFIPSSGISVRGSSEDYFKAHDLAFIYNYESHFRTRNSDINPIGRKVFFRYDYEASDINPEYTVENDGSLRTMYAKNKLHKIEASWLESIGLFNNKHTLSMKLRGGVIFGPEVDNFYNLYIAGLVGMKGYPFFSLGGGRMASLNLTYRFPIWENIDLRLSPLYFDKLYLGFFGDIGDAWEEKRFKPKYLKKDAGIELRLQAFSAYAFPTSIFFNAAYGFDTFSKNIYGENITYGKEWRFYFGILFGYDI